MHNFSTVYNHLLWSPNCFNDIVKALPGAALNVLVCVPQKEAVKPHNLNLILRLRSGAVEKLRSNHYRKMLREKYFFGRNWNLISPCYKIFAMREKFVSQNMENFNFVPTLFKTTSQELEQKPFPKKKSWRIFRELGGCNFQECKTL